MERELLTPIEYFYKWEKELADKPFLKQPFGDEWKILTWSEAGTEARKMASALKGLGLKKGEHIGISSKNCYHWILADLAIMIGGYISVPFYPSLTAEQLEEVLEKSDCKALFAGKVDKWDTDRDKVANRLEVIKFPQYNGAAEIGVGRDWNKLIELNSPLLEGHIPDLEEVWTIIFTSGTTGTPKGVMHTQNNAAIVIANEKKYNTLKAFDSPAGEGRFFSFLPLNHIAERAAVQLGSLMNAGTISFAESLDTFAKNLQETQPTFFFAVPRIWTKFQLGVLSKMPQDKLNRLLKIPLLSSFLKRKIKKTLGLSKANVMLTGASITPESLKKWYRSLGMNLREVYGMTENFGGFTLMPEHQHKPNTVGKPMPGAEGKIHPETGEIMMKMPWIMKGYYKDDALTEETIKDGWLHTGDKGRMDKEGYVKIIGRVKDTFKTSKGKFVVPTEIEDHFVSNNYIEQICVAGLGIPQPVALVCLSEIGMSANKEKINNEFSREFERINKVLHAHERLSAMVVVKEHWSDENKMLTPTLKIRRNAINEQYQSLISEWCDQRESIIWES